MTLGGPRRPAAHGGRFRPIGSVRGHAASLVARWGGPSPAQAEPEAERTGNTFSLWSRCALVCQRHCVVGSVFLDLCFMMCALCFALGGAVPRAEGCDGSDGHNFPIACHPFLS